MTNRMAGEEIYIEKSDVAICDKRHICPRVRDNAQD